MIDDDFAIGLDLGTTNSCIGVFRNGSVEIIPNRMGERTTPSIVTFLDNDIKVGEDTLDSLVNDYKNSVYQIKRFIGRKYKDEEVKQDKAKVLYPIYLSDNGIFPSVVIKRANTEKKYSPEEISSFIIKKMKDLAEEYLKKPIKKAVITVPAYFNDAQRNLTKQAAELVGIKVERVLNEPTAAALAYGLDENREKNSNILVFDLGGGTYDVSILKLKSSNDGGEGEEDFRSDGFFDVLATDGDTHLGGEDFDNVLVDYFITQFCNKYKDKEVTEADIRRNKKNMKKLKIHCESIKRDLSKAEDTVLCIDNFYDNKDILERISRKEFENLCIKLFEKLNNPLNIALEKAKLTANEINEVLLIGGSTRIPKIKEYLKEKFPNSKINDTINPDETVAYGATLYAAKIKFRNDKSVKGISLIDICPFSLGTEVMNTSENPEELALGEKMSFIIKKGTRIPCEKYEIYKTMIDNQPGISVEIYEGENNYVKYNHFLGKIILTDLPLKPAGKVIVKVKYSIDVNGIFTANVEETSTGISMCKVINDKVNLSEDEIKELQEKNKDDYLKQSKILPILENYQNMKKQLDMCESSFQEAEDDEEKIGTLINYNGYLEDYINKFDKNFDNEIILEKYFNMIHKLFINYSKTLKFNDLEKEEMEKILQNIKNYLDIFKNRSFGYITKLLEEIKEIKREKFYEIVIYCMDLMNTCGKDCLEKMKEFCRYHSILYFEHCLYLANIYINEKKFGALKNKNLVQDYERILKESKTNLNDINNNSIAILKQSKLMGKLIQGHSGFTYFVGGLKVEDKKGNRENLEIVLANYERMLREVRLLQNRDFTEEEAICIANIIKINYKFLGNCQFKRYLKLGEDCEFVVSKIKDFDKKKEWYQEFQSLIEKIKEADNTKVIYSNIAVAECRKNYPDIFAEIDNYFNSGDRKKFIQFIIEKHEYNGYEEDKKNNKINFEDYNKNLVDYLCKKYHPDEYELSSEEDIIKRYAIIHVISSKLSVIYSEFQ